MRVCISPREGRKGSSPREEAWGDPVHFGGPPEEPPGAAHPPQPGRPAPRPLLRPLTWLWDPGPAWTGPDRRSPGRGERGGGGGPGAPPDPRPRPHSQAGQGRKGGPFPPTQEPPRIETWGQPGLSGPPGCMAALGCLAAPSPAGVPWVPDVAHPGAGRASTCWREGLWVQCSWPVRGPSGGTFRQDPGPEQSGRRISG